MNKRRQTKQDDVASWLATFGDLATLLLTFYVLIYASSNYRPGEWETAQGAIERMLGMTAGRSAQSLVAANGDGPLNGSRGAIPLLTTINRTTAYKWKRASQAMREMIAMSHNDRYQGSVEIITTGDGYVFRLSEPVTYRLGSAELLPESVPFLERVAEILRAAPAEVTVEGHTCDLAVHGGLYHSNWELSGARAAAALRFLVNEGIGESSISAAAYGQAHPLLPNEDEASRRKNRRVEIHIRYHSPPGFY